MALAALLLAYAGALALASLAPLAPTRPGRRWACRPGWHWPACWRGGRSAWAGTLGGLLLALFSLGLPAWLCLLQPR